MRPARLAYIRVPSPGQYPNGVRVYAELLL
jgi:hypothetical protein